MKWRWKKNFKYLLIAKNGLVDDTTIVYNFNLHAFLLRCLQISSFLGYTESTYKMDHIGSKTLHFNS